MQIAREKELLDATAKEGAPHLTREQSAPWLGATAEELEAAALAKATEPTRQLSSGVTLAQAAAIAPGDDQRPHRLRHRRPGRNRQDPRGGGSSADVDRDAGKGDVILLAPSQNAADVLRQATSGQYPVYNTAQFLGHLEDERGALGPVAIKPGTLLLADESSMTSMADLRDIAAVRRQRTTRCSGRSAMTAS